MKVFEVICEYCRGEDKEIITERRYVTSEKNTLQSVVDYYTDHCEQYEKDLKSVREILVIVEHITEK